MQSTLPPMKETQNVTHVKIWRANGSVCDVKYPWMVTVNGYTLGEFCPARFQLDPQVFTTRKYARERAAQLVRVGIFRNPGGFGSNEYYAVPVV